VAIVQPADLTAAERSPTVFESFLHIEHDQVQTGIGTSFRET
jgi:hypothetical protein